MSSLMFLGDEKGMNPRDDTTLGDGHVGQELVDLLVIADGQQKVSGLDCVPLAGLSGVPADLQDLSSEILQHGSQVDGGDDLHGVVDLVVS